MELITNPLNSYRVWAGTSIAGSVLLLKLAPQYSVRHSYPWTAAAIFFSICLVYYIYAVVIWPRVFSPLRHLPQPTGNSFFNGQWSTITKDPSGIPLRRWINDIPNNGLIRYLHLFNRERLLITSPEGLREVLTTKSYDFVKPELLRSGIGQILGIGILFAEGDEHKVQRKNLMPAFNFRHIKELYPIFWSKSREMIECIEAELEKNMPNTSQEMGEWASRATLDIIGVAGLGQDFNALQNPDSQLNKTYRGIFAPSRGAQILGLLQFFIPGWLLRALPIKRNNDVMAASKVARDTSRELVRLKKLRMAEKKDLQQDIISVALESGGFTDEQLVDNMMTFLAAGHETTASAMTWAIYLMCQKPEVQQRLREEVRQHVDSLNDHVDSTKLDGMPYLHAVCSEVLRIYSPVPLTLRDTAVDTTILGQFIPRGTKVILCPWAVNHSKELWGEDASEFNPDRWMAPGQANSGGAVSNYAFLTFLHGPRSCIGLKFAVAELAALLAAFVGKFEFEMTEPNEEIIIKGGITARPRNGMRVNLKAVEGW
jgi:cytochrome P450